MNTETGKKLAQKRHEFMVRYLDQFFEEWNGKQWVLILITVAKTPYANRAFRFSKNAEVPSLKSGVPKQAPNCFTSSSNPFLPDSKFALTAVIKGARNANSANGI